MLGPITVRCQVSPCPLPLVPLSCPLSENTLAQVLPHWCSCQIQTERKPGAFPRGEMGNSLPFPPLQSVVTKLPSSQEQQIPGRQELKPSQGMVPADTEHPSTEPCCNQCPSPMLLSGNLAAGACSSAANPAPCHPPRAARNKHIHEPLGTCLSIRGENLRALRRCCAPGTLPGQRITRGQAGIRHWVLLVSAGHPCRVLAGRAHP